jgi:Tfp pilus assembly protein PilF
MSKPMLVTLPLVMLLIDYWLLYRYRGEEQEQGLRQLFHRSIALVLEKLPFFACSLFSGIITIYAQHVGGATRSLEAIPFMLRIENCLVVYVKYIIKTLWPHDLAVLYPIISSLPLWQVIGSLLVLLFATVITIRFRYRHPYFAVGWFWFLITLLPVIGIIQVGYQSMADRYTYIPVIGLFIMAAWGVPVLTEGFQHRRAIHSVIAGVVIVVSAALTWQQLGHWRDSISLFRHTIQVTSDNYLIHNNLGNALVEKGDFDSAIQQYLVALRINPNDSNTHYNFGVALFRKGYLDAAIQEYKIALRIAPNYFDAHLNMGVALINKGDLDVAIHEFQEALRIRPYHIDAHYNLGITLAKKGDLEAAIQEFQNVLRMNPNDTFAQKNLERALAKKNMIDEAKK